MGDGEPHTSVHRALADERRGRIVDELREHPNGLDVYELTERLGLHPNTVRWHLAILADAQLISSHAGERTTPGRPRIVYTLGQGAEEGEVESYRFLATILHGAFAQLEDGLARAEEAGRAWGRYLVRRPQPHARLSDADTIGEVVALLAQQGFRPEAAGTEIHMRRCPFKQLTETEPRIVCAVHLGLISGALAELGSELAVERLDVFLEPNLCIAGLSRAGSNSEAEPE